MAIAEEPEYVSEIEDVLENQLVDGSTTLQEKSPDGAKQLRNRYQKSEKPKCSVKFRGRWGFSDDNETDGYLSGYLIRRGRVGILKAGWNFTDNESKGRVFGLMKHGFINGRVITPKGAKIPLTGLYKINGEEETLKIRWMTPNKSGWAACKLISISE
jgi:hypothetical protein